MNQMSNIDETKGKVKDAVADLTGDNELKAEAKSDKASGKLKEFADKVEEKFEDAVDSVKDRLHRD
jgi:uncharacterized protein YjbJ (UPF0337 family)